MDARQPGHPFQHLPQYRVLVCVGCRFAVAPQYLLAHLQTKHPDLEAGKRRQIAEFNQAIAGLARTVDQVRFPSPDEPPCGILPVWRNGLRCTGTGPDGLQCRYIVNAVQKIQQHCSSAHGWQNKQRRGGKQQEKQLHPANRMWDLDQAYQVFFTKPLWKRNTAVNLSANGNDQSASQVTRSGVGLVDQFLARKADRDRAERQLRTIEGAGSRQETTAWLRFTGWHIHLAGFNRGELLLTIRPAAGERPEEGLADITIEDEEDAEEAVALARACSATRRLIRHAWKAARPEVVGRPALEAVTRRETGEQSNEKPFYAGHKVQTIRKYSRVWTKMLRYLWRMAAREHRPDYELTEEQQARLSDFRQAVHPDGEDGEEDEEGGSSRAILSSKNRLQAGEDASLAFWIAMFDHALQDREFESGIISAAAVLGLEVEKEGWKSALTYTPALSAIITTMRALVVYQGYQERQVAIERLLTQGLSQSQARRQAPAVVEGVDALTKRFMTIRSFGGMISPMDRLLHQRTYGLRIRYTTKAEGRVSWNGSRILIDSTEFSMDDIRTVVHGLVDTASKRLHEELLFVAKEKAPELDICQLVDNPVETTKGWSFLNDTRNRFAVDGGRWLLDRLASDEEDSGLERLFVGGLDGVERWEDIRWRQRQVEDYLRCARRFKEELLVLVHLSAGAPARATELLSIGRVNGTETRNQRGIFVDSGMVSFVTAYHKGFSASNNAKIIHRYVPREVGELVVKYLWLVEPFIAVLQTTRAEDSKGQSHMMWQPEAEEEWLPNEDEGELDEFVAEDRYEEREPDSDTDDEDEAGNGRQQQQQQQKKPENIDGVWDTDRVRRVMYRETKSRIGVQIGVAL